MAPWRWLRSDVLGGSVISANLAPTVRSRYWRQITLSWLQEGTRFASSWRACLPQRATSITRRSVSRTVLHSARLISFSACSCFRMVGWSSIALALFGMPHKVRYDHLLVDQTFSSAALSLHTNNKRFATFNNVTKSHAFHQDCCCLLYGLCRCRSDASRGKHPRAYVTGTIFNLHMYLLAGTRGKLQGAWFHRLSHVVCI